MQVAEGRYMHDHDTCQATGVAEIEIFAAIASSMTEDAPVAAEPRALIDRPCCGVTIYENRGDCNGCFLILLAFLVVTKLL